MQVIEDTVAVDAAFAARSSVQQQLWQALRHALEAQRAGHAAAQARLTARGKYTVRQRLDRLLDPQAPFLELSALAANADPQGTAGAGIVTGIGRVRGRLCMVIANDASVKGGTYQPQTLKKHLRAQAIAEANALPCLYLVDSGGIFLPRQAELFADAEHFGRMFANQARMSAQGIAQIAVVLGLCTAGGAYVPAMADENIIVRGQGSIFLAGPPLVKAATGEVTDAESLGGADLHCRTSGVTDHLAVDEDEALALCRDAVAALGPLAHPPCFADDAAPLPPRYPSEQIAGILPSDLREPFDVAQIIARLVDDSAWHPFKALYAPSLSCGFARLEGQRVGIVANNGVLQQQSGQKGAHFVQLCDKRGIPLMFLQNTTGFMVGTQAEASGIAKDGAKMVQAVACARVPKLTLIIGASHGAGNYAMCGRAFSPRFLFSWPNARISVMGPQQAAGVMVDIKAAQAERGGAALSEAEKEAIAAPLRERYTQEASAMRATSELWDDGLLLPEETRRALSLALAACRQAPLLPESKPVVRF